MNRSSRLAEKATTHYETAVLEAYGFMPMKENFLRFCHSAVHLPLIRSLLQLRIGARKGCHERRRNTDQRATFTLFPPADRKNAIKNYQERRVKRPWNYLTLELEKT